MLYQEGNVLTFVLLYFVVPVIVKKKIHGSIEVYIELN